MIFKFTYTADIDVPIEKIADDIDTYLDECVTDYVSDYNDVVATMSKEQYDSFIRENKRQIRKKVLDRLLDM